MMSSYYGNAPGTGMIGGTSYGSHGWMMSQAGYRWMTGNGTASPGWMAGGTLPPAMMSTRMMGDATDPGRVMGTLFAMSPGPASAAARPSRSAARSPRAPR